MARAENPYYTSPYPAPAWAGAGAGIARALFGDPEAAAKQNLQRAQMDHYQAESDLAREHAGIYRRQGAGMDAYPEVFGNLARSVAAHSGGTMAPPPAPAPVAPPMGGQQSSEQLSGLVTSLFPGAVITSGGRDPNSSLGRANPGSLHNTDHAIDVRPIPGQTFEGVRDGLMAHGAGNLEAIDEVKHPSAWATGPHWHFGSRGGGAAPMAAPAPVPTAPIPTSSTVSPEDADSLAQFLAAGASAQGERVDPSKLASTIYAFMGGDEQARRSLVAQGHTPGATFALTPERADAISARDAGEDFSKATSVASTNHANDVPVANIRAGASNYAADARAGASRYATDNRPPPKGGARADKGSKPPPASFNPMLDKEINQQLGVQKDENGNLVGGPGPKGRGAVKSLATRYYRENGGNLSKAVGDAIKFAQDRDRQGKQPAPKSSGAPPIKGARQARDGNWYVADPNRPGKYSRVDM